MDSGNQTDGEQPGGKEDYQIKAVADVLHCCWPAVHRVFVNIEEGVSLCYFPLLQSDFQGARTHFAFQFFSEAVSCIRMSSGTFVEVQTIAHFSNHQVTLQLVPNTRSYPVH